MVNNKNNRLTRFSDRVENYLRYRPHYPQGVLDFLFLHNMVKSGSVVADVGSGTGFSARPFLERNVAVIGIEPNEEMRNASEKYLSAFPSFLAIDGTAEHTTLVDAAVDAIIAAQAFHWFNIDEVIPEFKRIIKPGGYVILMWNDRQVKSSEFLHDYEKLLKKYGTDYHTIDNRNTTDEIIDAFFIKLSGKKPEKIVFKNSQEFNYEGLKGRLLSSSYVPYPGHENFESMICDLEKIFTERSHKGKVKFEYNTTVYVGKV